MNDYKKKYSHNSHHPLKSFNLSTYLIYMDFVPKIYKALENTIPKRLRWTSVSQKRVQIKDEILQALLICCLLKQMKNKRWIINFYSHLSTQLSIQPTSCWNSNTFWISLYRQLVFKETASLYLRRHHHQNWRTLLFSNIKK